MNNKPLGIILAIGVALAAKMLISGIGTFSTYLGQIISPTIVAIVLGIMIRNTIGVSEKYKNGVEFASKYILMLAIVVLGATLNFQDILRLFSRQPGIIYLIAFNICLSFSVAYGIGKLMSTDFTLRTFIGGGCSICGGTTVSALGPIIRANENQIAFGLSIVFFLDMITIILYPILGQMLHLSPEAFGVLAGTAINDTSSVLAAGDIYSKMAGSEVAYETASIVKLTRTSFLVLVAALFSIFVTMKQVKSTSADQEGTQEHSGGAGNFISLILQTFPWFIVFFMVMSLLNSLGAFRYELFTSAADLFHYQAKGQTPAIVMLFKDLSKFLIVVALAGVGLQCSIKNLIKPGVRPLLLGALTAGAVFMSSLTTIGLVLHL